ncbi:MAG: SUF system Fe-S cluster assembly protein [Hyphomicrobiaceae bacterium]
MDTKTLAVDAAVPEVGVSEATVVVPVVAASDGAAQVVAAEGDGSPVEQASALPEDEIERMTADIIAALKTVYDPEIPSDIYELGLIYRIDIEDDRSVAVEMTLTSPGCPVAAEMPGWVQNAVNTVGGVRETKVNLVFDPPWHQGRMSDEARLALNMF